jgi:hypothetical protein
MRVSPNSFSSVIDSQHCSSSDAISRLACEMTVRAGKVVFDLNARTGLPWKTAPLRYPDK